ncbi:MAG: hypothetical protein Q9211_004064 [Gyalolechia sp. 1 TL-2023]
MKASWAKRRHDGTDGHHGGPPTEQTILKRSRILTMPDKDHSAKIGQPKDNPRRQLFKGQHAIRSASGPKLPVLAPKPNTYNVQQTVPGGFVDTPTSPIPAPVTSLNAGLPSKSVLPIICKDDPALTEIFKANIYPALMKSKIRYQGTLPDTTLLAICKQVANETVDKKFQTFLRESEYQLDRRQRKRIKKYTKQKYAAKVRHTQEKIQSNNMLPSLEQRREAKNVNIAAAAESFGSQYASPTKQPIATALHERNEASRHHGMWKVGRADSENERPREAKPTAREERMLQVDAGLFSMQKLRQQSASSWTMPIQEAYLKQPMKIACPESGARKGAFLVVRATSNAFYKVVAVTLAKVQGKNAFSEQTVARLNRSPGTTSGAVFHVVRGTPNAGLICTFRPGDLEFNAKLPSDHCDASASLQSTFTRTVKDGQPGCYGSVPRSLQHDYGGEASPDFVRPDGRPGSSLGCEPLYLTARSQPERSRSNSAAFSLENSNRQSTVGRQESSLQVTQISPRKLRGHVRTSKVVDPAKEDLAQDIDWYDTLYPGHTSQRVRNRSTCWSPSVEQSTERHSDAVQPRSPQLIGPLHKKLPSAFNPELELAAVNASLCESDRPYKSSRRGHYDFVREEYLSLFYAMDSFDRAPYQVYDADTPDLRRQLKTRLGQASEERMTAIIKAAHSKPGTVLEHRKKKHIRAFIIDLTEDAIPLSAQPRLAIPSLEVKDKVLDTKHTTGSLLRNRELGHESPAQGINIQSALHQRFAETIRPWRSWKGASSDVVTVAWAPDSLLYAAGAAAQSDDNDLQYNRPHNLLVGDLRLNTISELPDHRVARPRPETVASGPNSSYAVYQACDPMVYKTVTSVQFSPWGGTLYTASHDKTVKIWDTSSGLPTCSASLSHDAEVTSLELSTHCPGYFATASKTIDGSVRVYQPAQQGSQDGLLKMNFSSSRALKHRNHDVYPECIRWGLTPGTKHLLLAGFQQWADHEYSAARQGQVCLWDVNTGVNINVRPHASAIFSVAWHPQEDIFITGGAPGGGPLSFPRTTKSVVRSYDTRNTSSYIHEFECPALDMQDVTLHPNSSNYVTAGCTDGTTYVWDFRWPDEIMHELHHGKPLQELAANEEELPYIEHRESLDAGVMLSIWGKGASLFYTGSSDGVIKAWDILRAPEDVWVRDVARLPAGVQSGALSPDGMNLLVGDAVGGVHVLSAAPFGLLHPDRNDDADGRDYKPDPIKFVYADEKKDHSEVDNPGTEGIDVANQLMKSGQTVLHPLFGVGKGPNYQGPLAKSARWNNIVSGFSELLPAFDRQQAFSVDGREQTEFSEKIRTLVAARKEQMVAGKQDSKPFTIVLGPPTPFVANRGTSAKPTPNYARASAPDLAPNRTLSAYTRPPSPSPSAPKTSRISASGKIPPAACSPPRAIAREIVDLTDEYFISPSTGSKRRRPSTASTAQPSTPTHASKRIKLEYVSPLQYPFQSPKPVRTTGVAVVDLTDDGVSEQATAIYLGSEGVYDVNANFAGEGAHGRMVPKKKKKKGVVDLSGKEGVEEEGNLLTWEEAVLIIIPPARSSREPFPEERGQTKKPKGNNKMVSSTDSTVQRQ